MMGWTQKSTLSPILPTPVTYIPTGDSLKIEHLSFNTSNLPEAIHRNLFDIAFLYGITDSSSLILNSKEGQITFQVIQGAYPNSYSISITKEGIRINYSSDASCFYAIQSLFQLLSKDNESKFSFPLCFVKDYPNFNWRGLHLDVSRHFFSVDEIKKYIDLMSLYKFNVFHWHLTDDQGWRIEIKKYPELTKVGAWRDSTVENHYSTFPRTYDKNRYGGFYTQDQIREIVKYAQDRYISIVPEIEMPGHARAALAAYPNLSCTGKTQGVEGLWGVFDDIFCSKNESIEFLKDVLTEVIDLFPDPYIHIGGDEAPKTRWENCHNCQKVMQDNHLANEHELQSYFIKQMDNFLTAHNKKLIGWDEILEGGLSPNAAVMSWRGMDGGIEAAKQGHFVVMSPGSHCYFDHYQSKLNSEPLAIGGFTPLLKVYEFSPIAPEMSPLEAGFVLGGQANLWTEYIPNFDQLTYMTYPRAIALSQTLWCVSKPSYQEFEKTLKEHHIARLMGTEINTSICLSFMKPNPYFTSNSQGVTLKFDFPDTNDSVVLSSKSTFIDGKWMVAKDSIVLPRQTKKTNQYQFTYFSICCADSITINPHLALGCGVKYLTKPNDRYNPGNLVLVDGQYAARPWRGYQWVGFDTNIVQLTVTLPKRMKIQEIELNFLYEPSSWIHLPTNTTIRDDKNNSKSFTISQESTICRFKTKTKSIYITIEGMKTIPKQFPGANNPPWLFMDEVVIH